MKVRKEYVGTKETEWELSEQDLWYFNFHGVCPMHHECKGCPFHVVFHDGSTSCAVTAFYEAGHKLEEVK